ncbi:NACHT and WD40 domain protein [Aspergillus eucalypticola CBS 122712]|uniref:NACHT and WD40 domain protein n=1 Tax=Aspergillus eucalypticola (strain CBS 122712 / IBT 29274) TaxID=1448314 RepID=A0A317V9T5_ASPEC|nr:NACHT and WD40 domain protein [Aspergillus eucalypticola CBS 122712]PWY68740.1 NACHT and WD40 domain protein [Aspergillus eucalypticola CBS 122712]
MKRYSKSIWRRFKGKEDVKPSSAVSPVVFNEAYGAQNPERSPATTQQIAEVKGTDLWQIAYEDLSSADKGVLAGTREVERPSLHRSRTLEVVDDVIEATKKQYEEYQKGGLKIRKGADKDAINVRDIAHKILNATLSFRGIAGVLVSGDQTGTASIAWGIVLLGLTITYNHHQIRKAQFQSAEFLTDVLTRCAFIEKEHYHDSRYETQDKVEIAIIQVYKGILRYTAQVYRMQRANVGERLLESLLPVTNHPLKEIEATIRGDEARLRQWVRHDEHLQSQAKAEELLSRIDEFIVLLKNLHRKFDLYNLPDAEGASFDSYQNQHEEECLPGTREDLLQQVSEWGSCSDGPCIFWLNGMAGTGKSTISRSLAQRLRDKGQLGATYFFKRGEGDRGHAKRFVSTIVRQLIAAIPDLAVGVSKAIEDDPDISRRGFRIQFEKLLLEPLGELEDGQNLRRFVIVVDALDECEEEQDISLLLQLFPRIQESKSVQLRAFITSRPELPIQLGFQEDTVKSSHRDLVLHKIPKPVIEHDISLFFRHKLDLIRKTRSLPPDWPGDSNFQELVKMSVPLFIFAATVCRVFQDHDLDPVQSLCEILEFQNEESKLDGTYLPVLQRLSTHNGKRKQMIVDEFREVVGTIVILESPLSVACLSEILGIPPRVINIRLRRLHAVLNIPDRDTMPVGLFHLSFRDFLLDPETREKTEFWIDGGQTHQRLAQRCLEVMQRKLRRNICSLPYEGFERYDISAQVIRDNIPPELEYSCRYWTLHLAHGNNLSSILEETHSFVQAHFLHWAEAMCVLGYASEIVGNIETLRKLIEEGSAISSFLYDALRFMLKCRRIADIAPLQLYCSGLIFAPSQSILRRAYEMPRWISRLPEVEDTWNAELETIEGHKRFVVRAVTFSRDGKWLASGSEDNTIKIWDAATSTLQQTLEGHDDSVISIAFSADGRKLVSGSWDRTVRVWDLTTSTHQTLKGHEHYVYSVCFSPDDCRVASGSYDHTAKIWDITSCTHQTLRGHEDWVYSVAFSPDGQCLATGSWDKTVKIWNTASGALQDTYKMARVVSYLAFSPDGRLAVSNGAVMFWDTATGTVQQTLGVMQDRAAALNFSQDGRLLAYYSSTNTTCSVKVWDVSTRTLRHMLEGHSGAVHGVSISPDKQRLASGAYDATIKLWDLNTPPCRPSFGEREYTAESHGFLSSMAFSPDGRWLASGGIGDTVKIWELETKLWGSAHDALRYTLEGHRRSVISLSFSPDVRQLASSSIDGIIKIWDPVTGSLQHTLEGHERGVYTVVFSPDGRWLASGSEDKTVRLWDPATGTLLHILKHPSWVCRLVAFSADGRWLATGSDRIIRIWDPPTGTLQHTIDTQKPFAKLVFSSDGQSVETGQGVYDLPPLYHSSPLKPESGLELRVENREWVTLQGKRILWLPTDYRVRNILTRDGVLVLGHGSKGPNRRSITLMKFCQ